MHLFLNRTATPGAVLQRDFAEPGTATKFEKHHPEFRGEFIHVELCATHTTWNKDDSYTDDQLKALAYAYVFASYRAGTFLTVTGHREVDRGFADGHNDPRGFDYEAFYAVICSLTGLSGKTFGLLNARGKVNNDKLAVNTFPAQYGPIEKEKVVPKKKKKKKP